MPSQTLHQFATASSSEHALVAVLQSITQAACAIGQYLRRAGLNDIRGASGNTNTTGDEQQRLDVLAHEIMKTHLMASGYVSSFASEEAESLEILQPEAPYSVTVDPLDGSSNIDVNIPVGIIFSVYNRLTPTSASPTEQDVLQPGTSQRLAGYVLFGSSTVLVYTSLNGVHGFTYDEAKETFMLSHPNIKMPQKGKIYSVNEGAFHAFAEPIQQAIRQWRMDQCKARYVGSLVADFHRNLIKGGIYLYPASSDVPAGKLRLVYECNALALLAEQAEGKAYCGKVRTLEIVPSKLHQRVPFAIGSAHMVDTLLQIQRA